MPFASIVRAGGRFAWRRISKERRLKLQESLGMFTLKNACPTCKEMASRQHSWSMLAQIAELDTVDSYGLSICQFLPHRCGSSKRAEP